MLLCLYGFLALVNGVTLAGFRAADAFASSGMLYQSVILVEAAAALGLALAAGGPAQVALAYLLARLAGTLLRSWVLRRTAPWLGGAGWAVDWREVKALLRPALAALVLPGAHAVAIQGSVMAIGAVGGPAAIPAFSVVRTLSHTYGYFNDVLQVFTEAVPRVLWKNKPFGAPFERFSMFDYGFPIGYTRSLPGNGWYALGWLGVIITCGVWGYVLGLIYRRFVEGPQSTYQVAAYMVFLPILIVAYRDGMLVTVFRQGIFYAAPILLWVWLARSFNVPLAKDLRMLTARKQRRLDSATAQASPARDPYQHLPPAVRRRRLALRK